MKIHTTVRSWGAIVLSAAFFGVTSYVLFQDVWKGAAITTDHVMTMAVLIGTIASGHMVWAQARQWHVFPAIGLALLFCVGTIYCVTASAGRNALATIEKGKDAHKVNEDRKRIETDLAAAKTRLEAATAAESDECRSGEGPKCKAQRTTREERQTYVNVLEAQLRLMAPEQPENADIKHTAKVFAALPWVKSQPEEIEAALMLFLPFFKAAFAEVATIIFASIGLGHRVAFRLPVPADTAQRSSPAPATDPPRGKRTRKENRQSNVVVFRQTKHPVVAAIEKVNRSVSNRELASLMGCSEGEASKRVREIEHQLVICRQGKELRIGLRKLA